MVVICKIIKINTRQDRELKMFLAPGRPNHSSKVSVQNGNVQTKCPIETSPLKHPNRNVQTRP